MISIFALLVSKTSRTIVMFLAAVALLSPNWAEADSDDAATAASTFDVELKRGAIVSLRRRDDKLDTP